MLSWYYIISFSSNTKDNKSTIFSIAKECIGKDCGVYCGKIDEWDYVCDGHGNCMLGLNNPCACHECKECGLSCGDECLMGDTVSLCDENNECSFNPDNITCGI